MGNDLNVNHCVSGELQDQGVSVVAQTATDLRETPAKRAQRIADLCPICACCRKARRAAGGLACCQPAVVGMGAGDVTAGDVASGGVSRRMPPMAGLAPASMVVVTGPAELPFSQAGQDSCQ